MVLLALELAGAAYLAVIGLPSLVVALLRLK
jgi:hypothetical protein